MAEQAKPHLRAHRQIEWLRRLERELGNIRTALDWSYSEDGPMERVENGLRIAADLHWFWQGRDRHLEGFQHLSRLLDLEQQRRGDQQLSQSMCMARAWALTTMVRLTDHFNEAIDLQSYNFPGMLNESLALFSQLGETGKLGFITTKFAKTFFFNEKPDDVFVQAEIYFSKFETLDDKLFMATCMMVMGNHSYKMDNDDLAEKYYQKAIILCEEIGDRDMTPFLWTRIGHAAYKRGDPEKARAYAMEAVNILNAVEDDLLAAVTYCYEHLGILNWKMGDYCQAEKYYQSVINRAKNSTPVYIQ